MTHPHGFDPPHVYILAGGRSRRFGEDKARFEYGGTPLILRLAEEFRKGNGHVKAVARQADQYADLGIRTVGDRVAGKGPLGGVLTALEDQPDREWVFVSACDWLGVRHRWIFHLVEHVTESAQCVVYEWKRVEPLFGLYHRSILPTIREQISCGVLALHNLIDRVHTVRVEAPPEWKQVVNVNKPENISQQ